MGLQGREVCYGLQLALQLPLESHEPGVTSSHEPVITSSGLVAKLPSSNPQDHPDDGFFLHSQVLT